MPYSPRFWLGLAAALALASWAYAQGLSGGFLFDDFANLPALGAMGPVDNPASFWRYVTSGTADPTGRPIALLSFLLDAQDWPADPRPFKRSNLILHLFNLALLALVLWRLSMLRPATKPGSAASIAVLGASLWGLHPLLVSTVLYVVQREAMLPATFVLLGLLCWMHGREQLAVRSRSVAGAMWMVCGLAGCMALATLCKANGILLPLLIATLELTVLQKWAPIPEDRRFLHRKLCLLMLVVPSIAVLGYLLRTGIVMTSVDLSGSRAWTIGERLLTQPRVLLDYLSMIVVPRPYTAGLFNDDFPVSTSLLSPLSTLPALAAIIALPAWAIVWRLRYPTLAAAILFFFAGHLLESTTIPLELYFEHRNYLPSLLLGWPLALGIWTLHPKKPTSSLPPTAKPVRVPLAISAALIMVLSGMTWARASLWGNPQEQALVWGALNQTSSRAQAYAARAEINMGRPDKAIQRLEAAMATAPPGSLQLALTLIDAHCASRHLPGNILTQAEEAFRRTSNPGGLLAAWIKPAIEQASAQRCAGLDFAALERLLRAGEQNATLNRTIGRTQDLLHRQGLLALRAGHADQAMSLFSAALLSNPRPALALRQAALLGSSGATDLALAHLDQWDSASRSTVQAAFGMPAVHAWVLDRQQYWANEIAHLRRNLRASAGTTPNIQYPS